jgi:arabinogalactan oligomer/maltooligosaccharide transport system permease protein
MTTNSIPRGANSPPALFSGSLMTTVLRLIALGLIDAFAIWFVSGLVGDEEWILAGFVTVITLGINAIFLINGLYPYRWFSPGLALLIVMLIYPTTYTVYVAFTNYRDENLLTRSQAEHAKQKFVYLPADARPAVGRPSLNRGPRPIWLWLIQKRKAGDVIFCCRRRECGQRNRPGNSK